MSRAQALTALAVCTFLTLIMFSVATARDGLLKDDAGQYARMAESPRYLARLPYTFRVLSPSLAAALPGPPIDGFIALTLLSLPLAGLALYGYQRRVGLCHRAALAGAALFSISGGAVRMLTTPTYVDSITYLSEAAALLGLASGQFPLFLASLVVGVLNRETALFLIPLYLLTPGAPGRSTRRMLVVLLPLATLGAVAVVRLWAGGVIGGSVPLQAIAPFSRTFRQDLPALTDLFDLYSVFGAMWLLAAMNLPGASATQRRALVFGALVVAQLLVSRGDEGRNLSHLFVVVIPLAMTEVERAFRRPGRGAVLGLTLIAACAASMVHGRWVVVESPTLRYSLVAVGTAIALAIAAAGRHRSVSARATE